MNYDHVKDAGLDRLAATANVAQFVSFDGDFRQRFARIRGFEPNHRFDSAEQAIRTLLELSPERSVNVRSFAPSDPKSRQFVYGLTVPDDAITLARSVAAGGLIVIVNETIDVNDGGVSGVAYGDVVEFAPGDTPRCVEKPGTASLPRAFAMQLFATVYGFEPALPGTPSDRVEFSIHPLRRGYRQDHTIVWELEATNAAPAAGPIRWPHRFSRCTGDKAFGLLIAALLGAAVPTTTVLPRRLAPFGFGSGGSSEPWLRTCPVEQVPGLFTTRRGWTDPFALMAAEDPDGQAIASILHQHGIEAVASGAAAVQQDGTLLVEGVTGFGDSYMLGERPPEPLPAAVVARVRRVYEQLAAHLGPVRLEWADDGQATWVVQLHVGALVSQGDVIVPGEPASFRTFDVTVGLEGLRRLIDECRTIDAGILLVGDVGITSHFGDVLRKAGVPSRLSRRFT